MKVNQSTAPLQQTPSIPTDESVTKDIPVRPAIRKSAGIKKRKLIGNVPRTDSSLANAVNRVNHRTRRNIWARKRPGPRDILITPGLNKIALFVPKPEKEEPQNADSELAADPNDVVSVGLETGSGPMEMGELSVELNNSNEDGNGPPPTPVCQCKSKEKCHELEKIVEQKNLEIEQLKDEKKKILEHTARAGAKSLKVILSPCTTNDVDKETADVANIRHATDSDSEYFPSGIDSEEEMFSVVPRGASATARMRTRTTKQPPPPSYTGEKIIETNSAAFGGDCVVQAAETSGSSGGVEDSSVIPAATGAPSSTTKHSEDTNASNEPAVLHKIDEKLLRVSQFGCICGMRYNHRSSLLKHVNTRSGIKCFKCEHCPEVFALMGDLNSHLCQVHNTQPTAGMGCRFCGQVFKTKGLLIQHKKATHGLVDQHVEKKKGPETHGYAGSGLQGHLCKCGRSFEKRNTFNRHIAMNLLPNKFKCPRPHCGAQYTASKSLQSHVRRDHDLPNYEIWGCYKCGATFPNRRQLFTHKLNH